MTTCCLSSRCDPSGHGDVEAAHRKMMQQNCTCQSGQAYASKNPIVEEKEPRVLSKQFRADSELSDCFSRIVKVLELRGYRQTNSKFYPGIKTSIYVFARGDRTTIVKVCKRPLLIEIETNDRDVSLILAGWGFRRVEIGGGKS